MLNVISRSGSASFSDNFASTSTQAINADQSVFESAASSGSGTLGPLAGVVIATSVPMALVSAWALSRRLAEYR